MLHSDNGVPYPTEAVVWVEDPPLSLTFCLAAHHLLIELRQLHEIGNIIIEFFFISLFAFLQVLNSNRFLRRQSLAPFLERTHYDIFQTDGHILLFTPFFACLRSNLHCRMILTYRTKAIIWFNFDPSLEFLPNWFESIFIHCRSTCILWWGRPLWSDIV